MDFVNFEDAKKRLGKTDEELQDMIRKGELRGFRDGGTWKFRKEDIEAKAAAAAPAGGEKEAGDTLMSIDADILFAEEEEVPADSAAETWIAADTEGVFPGQTAEQGRGVADAMTAPETEPAPLALSPETDESSLGAVLSDEELGAGEAPEEPVIAVDTESGVAAVVGGASGAAAVPSRTRIVTLIEPPAHHAQFTFMLGLAAVALALAVVALMALLANATPSFVEQIAEGNTSLIILVAGAVIVGIAALVGYVFDKQRAAREALGG